MATTDKCPNCGALVKYADKSCRYCGAQILFDSKMGRFVRRDGDDRPPKIAVVSEEYGEDDGMIWKAVEAIEFTHQEDELGRYMSQEVEYVAVDFREDIFAPRPPVSTQGTREAQVLCGIVVILAIVYATIIVLLGGLSP